MGNLKRIREELVSALIALNNLGISEKERIIKCEAIIMESIKFLDPLITLGVKKDLYIEIAGKILSERHQYISVIHEEHRESSVWFEFYSNSHDYSAGRDSDIISHDEIEKYLLLNPKTNLT